MSSADSEHEVISESEHEVSTLQESISDDEEASPLERKPVAKKKSKRQPRKVLKLDDPEPKTVPDSTPEPVSVKYPDTVTPAPAIDEELLAYMDSDHYKNKMYLKPPQIIERIIEREVPVERVIEKLVPVEKIVEKEVYIDRVVRDVPDIAFGRSRRNVSWL